MILGHILKHGELIELMTEGVMKANTVGWGRCRHR